MLPNAHAENGVTSNRKVSKMKSKCGPEGVPKTDKRQYQTVISDFGCALVRVLRPWGQAAGQKGSKRGGQSGSSGTQASPARHLWRIAVLPRPQRLWNHLLQASFFGHRWIACDHPCALVSGVGPCLHLCALYNMQHRIWYMEYGLWNTIWYVGCGMWNMEYSIWSTA